MMNLEKPNIRSQMFDVVVIGGGISGSFSCMQECFYGRPPIVPDWGGGGYAG
ncbi:hypothetical protein STEG23_008846, partial [Scotinomys teguina]